MQFNTLFFLKFFMSMGVKVKAIFILAQPGASSTFSAFFLLQKAAGTYNTLAFFVINHGQANAKSNLDR